MRSVYAKVILWCLGMTLVSLAAFSFITTSVRFHIQAQGGAMPRLGGLVLQQATEAYQKAGPAALGAYLKSVQPFLHGQRYLVGADGKDLVTGEDRSGMLHVDKSARGVPVPFGSHMVLIDRSVDGRFTLLAMVDPPSVFWNLAPYYFMILAAVGALCWALAFSIASPLRELSHVVERFGSGELEARANFKRRDEIGELATAFDQMAERIGTLVDAERRLLQDVSHELRAPLARMSFAAELARTAANRDTPIARIKKEILRLSTLIGTLVEMTSAEGDPACRNWAPVPLKGLLSEVIDDCWVDADARLCGVILNANGEVISAGDRDLLRRAIENVLLNAIRYTPQGSTVEITLNGSERTVRIRVRDYGPGVPQDALLKIFQPFFRVDDSRDTATGGIGLGLAIARRAIALHRGRIWAENVEPGLAVMIELPLTAFEAASA